MINVTFYIMVKQKFIKYVIREIKKRATKIARNITFVIQIKKVQSYLAIIMKLILTRTLHYSQNP